MFSDDKEKEAEEGNSHSKQWFSALVSDFSDCYEHKECIEEHIKYRPQFGCYEFHSNQSKDRLRQYPNQWKLQKQNYEQSFANWLRHPTHSSLECHLLSQAVMRKGSDLKGYHKKFRGGYKRGCFVVEQGVFNRKNLKFPKSTRFSKKP